MRKIWLIAAAVFAHLLTNVVGLRAESVKIGMTEAAVIRLKGDPKGRMSLGHRDIMLWSDAKVVFQDDRVVGVMPKVAEAHAGREAKGAVKRPEIVAESPKAWSFRFVRVKFDWRRVALAESDAGMLVPEISYSIENCGDEAIRSLRLRFVFYESKHSIFDDVNAVIVSPDDSAFEPGIVSKRFFSFTSNGFVLKREPFVGEYDPKTLEGYNWDSIVTRHYLVIVFAAEGEGAAYVKFGEFDFRRSP